MARWLLGRGLQDHEDGHEGGGGGDREVEVTAWDRDPQEEED